MVMAAAVMGRNKLTAGPGTGPGTGTGTAALDHTALTGKLNVPGRRRRRYTAHKPAASQHNAPTAATTYHGANRRRPYCRCRV